MTGQSAPVPRATIGELRLDILPATQRDLWHRLGEVGARFVLPLSIRDGLARAAAAVREIPLVTPASPTILGPSAPAPQVPR